MKKVLTILLISLLLLSGCTPTTVNGKDGWSELASTFVAHLAAEEYEEAFAYFDDTMQNALPLDDLVLTWNMVQEQAGEYVGEVAHNRETQTPYEIAIVTGEFAGGYVDIRVVLTEEEKTAGLFFQPSTYSP